MGEFPDKIERTFEGDESETGTPRIRLEFFRHDEKGKATTAGDRTGDEYVRLTDKGREGAKKAGAKRDAHPEVGIAIGSPRERAQEAALQQLLANEESINATHSLEEVRAKIAEGIGTRVKKDSVSKLLDFNWDGSKKFHDESYRRYLETKDVMKFFLDDSDDLVQAERDGASTSYSRAAGNIAEMVNKYVGVLPNWEKLLATPEGEKKYEDFNGELQRFLASHNSVLECFLLKAIEKSGQARAMEEKGLDKERARQEGRTAAEEYIESMPDKNGFGYSEGFSVTIEEGDKEPIVRVSYNGQNWELSPQALQEMIQERDALAVPEVKE